MRLRFALFVLAALASASLAALTPAAAQWGGPQYTVVLTIVPPTDPLTRDAPKVVLDGRVEFTGDPTAHLNLNGVPVSYQVTKAPAWATVSVSPAHDVIPITQSHLQVTGSRTFTVTVIADEDAVAGTELIEIVATVSPTTPQSPPRSAAQSAPVQYVAPEKEEDCPEEGHVQAYALFAEEEPAAPEEEMTVQTGGVTPVSTWYALGGFALAGAGAGLALLRRRRA